jgi:hypothetical protein
MISVNIPQVGSIGLAEKNWRTTDGAESANRRINAARNNPLGFFEEHLALLEHVTHSLY